MRHVDKNLNGWNTRSNASVTVFNGVDKNPLRVEDKTQVHLFSHIGTYFIKGQRNSFRHKDGAEGSKWKLRSCIRRYSSFERRLTKNSLTTCPRSIHYLTSIFFYVPRIRIFTRLSMCFLSGRINNPFSQRRENNNTGRWVLADF